MRDLGQLLIPPEPHFPHLSNGRVKELLRRGQGGNKGMLVKPLVLLQQVSPAIGVLLCPWKLGALLTRVG